MPKRTFVWGSVIRRERTGPKTDSIRPYTEEGWNHTWLNMLHRHPFRRPRAVLSHLYMTRTIITISIQDLTEQCGFIIHTRVVPNIDRTVSHVALPAWFWGTIMADLQHGAHFLFKKAPRRKNNDSSLDASTTCLLASMCTQLLSGLLRNIAV